MLYARPGVAGALIDLQDRAGHNVNLILFGLWLAVGRRRRLDALGLTRAREAVAKLDSGVVAPLRDLRRRLKSEPDLDVQALRQRLLAVELGAERRIQARLAATVSGRITGGSRLALAEANLRLILGKDDYASPQRLALSAALAGL